MKRCLDGRGPFLPIYAAFIKFRQLGAVTDKIEKVANIWRRNNGKLDHVAHEQVADPFIIWCETVPQYHDCIGAFRRK